VKNKTIYFWKKRFYGFFIGLIEKIFLDRAPFGRTLGRFCLAPTAYMVRNVLMFSQK
jgi:hypothetical protein